MTEMMRSWVTVAVTSWRDRRTEDGGLTDDVAMMAILVVIAVAVGGILLGVLTGAVSNLNFGIGDG
jgi:hypothetical protein